MNVKVVDEISSLNFSLNHEFGRHPTEVANDILLIFGNKIGRFSAGKGIAIGTVAVAQFLKAASESQNLEHLADRLEDGNERLQKFNLLGKFLNWLVK